MINLTIQFIEFDPKNVIPEGKYWIITKTNFGEGYLSAPVTNVGSKMSVDVTNQQVLYISTTPVNSK